MNRTELLKKTVEDLKKIAMTMNLKISKTSTKSDIVAKIIMKKIQNSKSKKKLKMVRRTLTRLKSRDNPLERRSDIRHLSRKQLVAQWATTARSHPEENRDVL